MEDVAWAAGFFDGEGSINIVRQVHQRSGRKYHALDAAVVQVDPRPLLHLQERYGGAVSTRAPSTPNAQVSFRWTLRNAAAAQFLQTIRPWCRVKGEQIDIALAFRQIKLKGTRYTGCDDVAVAQREAFKKQLEESR